MKNVPENELLSAYLDGELTAEEQAQVERLLGANPEARQLVDELRALSSSVKALPPHKIGRDISEEVVSRAKRRMPAQPTPARPAEQETPKAEAPPWRAIVRRVARPRNFVWSGVAVAVVVLLMVMKPDTLMEPRARSVAMKATSDADEAAATAGPAPSMQARGEAGEEWVAQEPAPAEMPAGEPPSRRMELAESEAEERESPMAAARRAPLATAPSAAPSAAPPATIEQPAKAPTRSRRAGDGYRVGVGVMEGREGRADVADDRGRPETPRVAKRGAYKGQPSVTGKKAKAPELGLAAESVPAKRGQRRRRSMHQPDVLLVVSCDVTVEALRGNVFKELLQRHEMMGAMMGAVAGGRMPGRISAGEPVAPADEPDVRVVAGKPFEVVDVEATPDQIKALLADLHERPGQFSSLSYALDPAAVSRGLGRLEANGQVSAQRQAGRALDEGVQTLDEPAAETLQQKLSRTDVDKVLDLARRFRYGRPLGEKAEAGATFGVEAQPAARAPQKEGRTAAAIPQSAMDREQLRAEPKVRASLAGPGAGAARPGGTGAYGAAMQSATPAEPVPPAEAPAAPPADPFQAEMEPPSKAQADKPQPERPLPKRAAAREPRKEEQEAPKRRTEADRSEMAQPLRQLEGKLAEERGSAETQQMLEQEPTEAQRPALPAEGERLDRDSGRYRVRFVLRVVRSQGGNVAASVAKDAPMIDRAGEAAEAAPEAPPAGMASPQAPAAQAAEIVP